MGEFQCNLKKHRQLKELPQEQSAETVVARRKTIMRLEAGKYSPSLKLAIDTSKIVEFSDFTNFKSISFSTLIITLQGRKQNCFHPSFLSQNIFPGQNINSSSLQALPACQSNVYARF